MSTATIPEQQRLVLTGVSWEEYLEFEKLLDDRAVRLTYNRGRLEFMTLSHLHEHLKKLLGQLIEVLLNELRMPRKSGGSTTFKKKDLDRGLEPDQCYYLDNEPLVRHKIEIDLDTDPPPDLAVEIEVSRSIVDRLDVLAAIGVQEIWCYDGQSLIIRRLNEEGKYEEVTASRYFPRLSIQEIEAWLIRRNEMDETSLIVSFQSWVRQWIQQRLG